MFTVKNYLPQSVTLFINYKWVTEILLISGSILRKKFLWIFRIKVLHLLKNKWIYPLQVAATWIRTRVLWTYACALTTGPSVCFYRCQSALQAFNTEMIESTIYSKKNPIIYWNVSKTHFSISLLFCSCTFKREQVHVQASQKAALSSAAYWTWS